MQLRITNIVHRKQIFVIYDSSSEEKGGDVLLPTFIARQVYATKALQSLQRNFSPLQRNISPTPTIFEATKDPQKLDPVENSCYAV